MKDSGRDRGQTFKNLESKTSEGYNRFAEVHYLNVPVDRMRVGTLDKLMVLSDELVKVDATFEGIVRRIERQHNELNEEPPELKVDNLSIDDYMKKFLWDEAKVAFTDPIPDIVKTIQENMGKVEDDLKELASAYSEKKQALQAVARSKKGAGNMMVADLSDILTPENGIHADAFVQSEYMTTLVVVMNRSAEKEWLDTYQSLGMDIAHYGPPDNRGATLGSPVVPNSTRKLMDDGETCIYNVTILKGDYSGGRYTNGEYEESAFNDYTEQFKRVCREKRFIVRDFEYDPEKQAAKRNSEAQLENDVSKLWRSFNAWCKVHFGIAYSAWMHIKMIRIFVESVLRYGLPVNFIIVFFKPYRNKGAKLREVLGKMFAHLDSQDGGQYDGDDTVTLGLQSGEFYPYVSSTFYPKGV